MRTSVLLLAGLCIGAAFPAAAAWADCPECPNRIVYVNTDLTFGNNDGTSWENAYYLSGGEPLDRALSDATLEPGDCIFVAGGNSDTSDELEYFPEYTGATSAFYLPSGIKLFGGFNPDRYPEPECPSDRGVCKFGSCKLSQEEGGGEYISILHGLGIHYSTVVAMDCEGCTIDGFRLTGGDAIGVSHRYGGALYMRGGSMAIDNCEFVANVAGNGGGAISVSSSEFPATLGITWTKFQANGADSVGGAIHNEAAELHLSHCWFQDNTSTNHGGALWNGQAYQGTNQTTIDNVLFYDNRVKVRGGAIYNTGGTATTVTLTNTTLVENKSEDPGGCGGIASASSAEIVTIKSSILWANDDGQGNAGTEEDQISGGDVDAQYGDIQIESGLFDGDGNINEDPALNPSSLLPGRIILGSPCMDAGDPAGVAWELDLDDALREVNGRVDMGVNEVKAGACCHHQTCSEVYSTECVPYICDVWALQPPSFTGCYADADGNGVVNAADRGFISANIGNLANDAICLYDMDGNGVINAGDRGFVSAAIGLCLPLPDWQNGSGENNGVFPDKRFPYFFGEGTDCDDVSCTAQQSMMMGGGESYSYSSEESEESASLSLAEASAGWYSLEISGITIEGAVILGATDQEASVFEAAGVTESIVDLSTMFANPIPAMLFGSGYTRHDMLMLDGLSVSGEICQVRAAQGATLRLEVYVWRTVNGAIKTYAAALAE